MPVKIFCACGTEITKEVPLWDWKTRSVSWMDRNSPPCAACLESRMDSPTQSAPVSRNADVRQKER